MLSDTRILLEELIDNIERSFAWLGTTTDQEININKTMNESICRIFHVLNTRGQFDTEFSSVLNALRGTGSNSEVELFQAPANSGH